MRRHQCWCAGASDVAASGVGASGVTPSGRRGKAHRLKVGLASYTVRKFTLDQAEEAYRLFDAQTAGKGVILPS